MEVKVAANNHQYVAAAAKVAGGSLFALVRDIEKNAARVRPRKAFVSGE